MEKVEHNFVVGFVDGRDGRTVIKNHDGKPTRLSVDYSCPITLERCAKILNVARSMTGRLLTSITLHHSIYSNTPGNEFGDGPETCFLDMRYDYDGEKNSLVIYKNGEPVYVNDDGEIARDEAAIYDCM